jgi:AcrR family transcriptional regulator
VAKVGPAAVSGRAVARAARVHHAQVQQMFGSVEDLVRASVTAGRDEFMESAFPPAPALPDPLVVADFPIFWRAITQLLLDPGPIDMRALATGGPISVLSDRISQLRPAMDREVQVGIATAWFAAPLGALIFREPLQRGLRIRSRSWPQCWRRLGQRLRELPTLESPAVVTPHVGVAPEMRPRVTPLQPASKEKLVVAAVSLLGIRLEAAVTGRELADHAGVNYGLVSHYFKSKSRVFDEALSRLHRAFLDDVLNSDDAVVDPEFGQLFVLRRHRTFLRAWASRLLTGKDVPDFPLMGMERLAERTIAERAVPSHGNGSDSLETLSDCMAAIALLLGWTLLRPLPTASAEIADLPLDAQLHWIYNWLLSPVETLTA